jgi:RimJ/RimL family protein N-acetyltransferase
MSIRKLFPSEASKLSDHLVRLTPEARSLRFMGGMHDVAVREHCERLNWLRTVVIGYLDAGVLRAAAELHVASNHVPVLCEVAVTVETAWQGQGVATELVRRALGIARNRSARRAQISCFGDNYGIQRIARKFGAQFRFRTGEAEAELPIPGPTYMSLCEELINDGFACMSVCLDHVLRRTPAIA